MKAMKKGESEKEIFGRYVCAHTVSSYKRAVRLYEFSKALNLTKEDIVKDYGDPESLYALNLAKVVWHQDIGI